MDPVLEALGLVRLSVWVAKPRDGEWSYLLAHPEQPGPSWWVR